MTTFNVCYTREYIDPENESETFNSYETIYRNVPIKYLKKFTDTKMKMKLLKYCDWNYKDHAANFMMCLVILVMMRKIKKECLTIMVKTGTDNL